MPSDNVRKELGMFHKVLIANRGEIAVRIIRALRELGIKSVAVYSEADKDSLHAKLADEAICIGPASPVESYLNMERIISATISSGAEAIHPGFGFLSENAKFVEMCEKCNIKVIGPPSDVIRKMGNKSEARNTMTEANIPVVPGSDHIIYDVNEAHEFADKIGYPVIIKAALGGGGKGMRIAENSREFEERFETARMESENAFADDGMYIEKYIVNPRHIEFQIMADSYGNVVHLGERDCTIQRNHQKMLEESPSSAISPEMRKVMGETAVRAAKAAHYENAGTIEFLLDKDNKFYFMEMNTRIQVEHPITEWITGIDLIKEQIRIADGKRLSYTQDQVKISGHAIEVRINAERPEENFLPCPGTITGLHLPGGKGVRIDSAIYSGYTIPPYYDSMIAKISVWAKNRREAIQKMQSALGEVIIEGVDTNVNYQYALLNHPDFLAGNIDIEFIDRIQQEA
mgnify:CR=1 FL=1